MMNAKASSKADGLFDLGNEFLVEMHNLRVYFPGQRTSFLSLKKRFVHAVDDTSLWIRTGENLGLVGESGCGKTTLGRSILRLNKLTSGRILFGGRDVSLLKGKELRAFRRLTAMIFQDSYGSLNPRLSVLDLIGLPLSVHGLAGNLDEKKEMAAKLLEDAHLDYSEVIQKYPHQLSGGQRQRVAIAQALASEPTFIVADEPVSMIDVSIRAGILNTLLELGNRYGLTYLFITHDLAVAEYFCQRIAVMYLGKIVELAPSEALIRDPLHPYSELLIAATPKIERIRDEEERLLARGEISGAAEPPLGCRFHPRCPSASERCSKEEPSLTEVGPGRYVSCLLFDKTAH